LHEGPSRKLAPEERLSIHRLILSYGWEYIILEMKKLYHYFSSDDQKLGRIMKVMKSIEIEMIANAESTMFN
jgi:hypothetical protein